MTRLHRKSKYYEGFQIEYTPRSRMNDVRNKTLCKVEPLVWTKVQKCGRTCLVLTKVPRKNYSHVDFSAGVAVNNR